MLRRVVSGLFIIGLGVALPAAASTAPTPAEESGRLAPAPAGLVTPAVAMSDEATMVLLGTALIGLAGAVRRAA